MSVLPVAGFSEAVELQRPMNWGYVYSEAEAIYGPPQSSLQRVKTLAISFFRNVRLSLTLAYPFLKYTFSRPAYYCSLPSGHDEGHDYGWKEGSKGLYVLVTGLKGHPVWAEEHCVQLQREQPEMEVRVPAVHKQGNCNLQEAATPIVHMVRDYIRRHPGLPICLIGTSNGGRIVAEVETALRNEGAAIRVSSIAGVFFGSKAMDALAQWKRTTSLVLDPEVIEDLKTGSKGAIDLIEKMRIPLEDARDIRDYEFYATAEDDHIPNFSSCLPLLGKGERHYLVFNESHLSIVPRVREQQLRRAHRWMKDNYREC